ncbi:hypothetical protein [Kitasatospora sp. NPDC058046]|uniref:hypothetical protein n=1 Tax=Kitasatospora sp. NPDC058046 TaxID=3346312 RepID=UPI0036DF4A78
MSAVMLSHALTGADPAGLDTTSRAHLAWSAGRPAPPPADGPATVIAETAVTVLLDLLGEPELAETALTNRPGPFHSCPATLSTRFKTTGGIP